jgi:hypothetical protein
MFIILSYTAAYFFFSWRPFPSILSNTVVEHIAFVPGYSAAVVVPFSFVFPQVVPPLLGTKEREDLYRSLTPFSPLQEP